MKKSLMTILAAAFLFLNTVLPVFAADSVTVSVHTDQSQYKAGSTIIVTGTVLKNGEAGIGTSPKITLKNNKQEKVEVYQWTDKEIDSNGNVKASLNSKKYENGTYTIEMSASGASKNSTTFTIVDQITKKKITASVDKAEYTVGDKVSVTGAVSLDGMAVSNEVIYLTIDREGTPLPVNADLKTDAQGMYSYQFDTANAAKGMYTFTVKLSDKTISAATKTFKLNESAVPDPGTGGSNPTNPEPNPNPGPGDGTIPVPSDPTVPAEPVPSPTPTPIPDPTTTPYAPKVDKITSESTKITGTADLGVTVVVTDKDRFRVTGTASVKDGSFAINLSSKLKAGTTLYATATAGSLTSTETVLVVEDTTPPAAPSVNPVSDKDTKVTGKAEAHSTVTVKSGNTVLGSATAVKGAFLVKMKKQKAGTMLTVTAADKAGNVSSSVSVNVADKTAPAKPSINQVSDKSVKVTGKAEASSKVTVKNGKKVLGTGTASKKGAYSITIKKQKAEAVLTVTATDKAGNASTEAKRMVVDKTAPRTPTVKTVKTSSVKITGTAEAGSKVYVKAGKKVIGSAIAAKNGTYSVKIKKQKAGTTLAVYSKDKAGNISKSKSIKVKK